MVKGRVRHADGREESLKDALRRVPFLEVAGEMRADSRKPLPTLAACEEALGEPASAWVARCHEIALRIHAAGLVDGRVVYGHWRGPISRKSHFASRRGMGFCNHGWVFLPDGRVFDPTRWAFEAKAPYLYVGPNDHYDEGGNVHRMLMMGPPPAFHREGRVVRFEKHELDAKAWTFVEKLLGHLDAYGMDEEDAPEPGEVSFEQVQWLSRCDPDFLEPHAKAIFEALVKKGFGAFIPIDNRRKVLGVKAATPARVLQAMKDAGEVP